MATNLASRRVVQFNGVIYIYKRGTLSCCHGTENFGILTRSLLLCGILFKLTDLSCTNFIMLRIYAEALDRLRVLLNMYLVIDTNCI